jgi:hypothetical protein
MTMEQVDSLYKLAANYSIQYHSVASPEFERFSRLLSWWIRNLPEGYSDHSLLESLRSFWVRFRFAATVQPIPFSAHKAQFPLLSIEPLVTRTKLLLPNQATHLEKVWQAFMEVYSSKDNPLGSTIRPYFKGYGSAALVVPSAYQACLIEKMLDITVLHPSRLKGMEIWDQLVVTGHPAWYPQFVFDSPRAHRIEMVMFDWILTTPPVGARLEGSVSSLLQASSIQWPTKKDVRQVPIENLVTNISETPLIPPGCTKRDDGHIAAMQIFLAGQKGLYLEPSSKVFTLVPSQGAFEVQYTPVPMLTENHFLLWRTDKNKDAIAAKSDELLGDAAIRIHQQQATWKVALHRMVKKYGMKKVLNLLKQSGATHACEQNVRNWISKEKIKPRDYADFLAIFRILNLESWTQSFWNDARLLHIAHQKAGSLIRQVCIEEIRKARPNFPELGGQINFYLPKAAGAEYSAIRIEQIRISEYPISAVHLRQILHLKR